MFRMSILALLVTGLLATPSVRAADKSAADTAEKIIAVLHDAKLKYEKDLRTTPFQEVLDDLEKMHGLKFIINKAKFGAERAMMDAMKAEMLNTKVLDGMCLHAFLKAYMAALPLEDVTYVVRPDHIEITTKSAVREEAGLDESETDDATPSRINLPMVCLAVKEKQLSAVFDELRRVYGLNIVAIPSRADNRLKTSITIQLLNVPADTALELIAEQAELGVVRKGNTFRIISNPGG
jgi:hypothetical protein